MSSKMGWIQPCQTTLSQPSTCMHVLPPPGLRPRMRVNILKMHGMHTTGICGGATSRSRFSTWGTTGGRWGWRAPTRTFSTRRTSRCIYLYIIIFDNLKKHTHIHTQFTHASIPLPPPHTHPFPPSLSHNHTHNSHTPLPSLSLSHTHKQTHKKQAAKTREAMAAAVLDEAYEWLGSAAEDEPRSVSHCPML